jgi:hypothetical protein
MGLRGMYLEVAEALDEEESKRKYVIKGTCSTCGRVPGTVSRPLTLEERHGLRDAGYKLDTNALGDDIASGPTDADHYNDALAHYCRAGHPKTYRRTWQQRILDDEVT